MSIARAFTTRRVKQSLMGVEGDSAPHRSNTTKGSVGSIRHKISAPVELIYTTNMLSYNAPDLFSKSDTSPSSSHKSDDDLSDSAPTTASTPPTSPDIESPPKGVLSPEPNHLSCYFTAPGQTTAPGASPASAPVTRSEAPAVPQRAASHTKKSYDGLVRQRSSSRLSEQSHRSLSTKASFSFSRSSSSSTNTAATSQSSTPPSHKAKASGSFISSLPQSHPAAFSQPPPPPSQLNHRKDFSQSQHPFGQELAQVSEIAEEYGVKEKLNEVETEEQELVAKGLSKFSADDYLAEIHGLIFSFFADMKPVATPMWI